MALLKFEDLGLKTQDQIKKLAIELGFDANRGLFWESLSEKDKDILKNAIENKKYHPKNKDDLRGRTLHTGELHKWSGK